MGKKHLFIPVLFWSALLGISALFFIVKYYKVDEEKAIQFDKIRDKRRNKIRKAKENHESLSFQQDREGVTRHLWLQDTDGLRRQFLLEAHEAKLQVLVDQKKRTVKETFIQPKGWLQEKLFWQISSTKEHVIPKGLSWVYEQNPSKAVLASLVPEIVPMQESRFFDAATAEWELNTNELIAHDATFCVIIKEGHDLPENLDPETVQTRGKADSITFSFDKQGHEQVFCNKMKLELTQGIKK